MRLGKKKKKKKLIQKFIILSNLVLGSSRCICNDSNQIPSPPSRRFARTRTGPDRRSQQSRLPKLHIFISTSQRTSASALGKKKKKKKYLTWHSHDMPLTTSTRTWKKSKKKKNSSYSDDSFFFLPPPIMKACSNQHGSARSADLCTI